MIDLEMLQSRVVELDAQKERAKANLNAVLGALQECNYYITILQKELNKSEEIAEETVING